MSSAPDACLNLMETLVQLRHQPIHGQLSNIGHRYSMLHLDVLLLVYHFATVCGGGILEIGAFLGGATMAAVLGARTSGKAKTIVTIEPGGSVAHDKLGSRDILRDLRRILLKLRMRDDVVLIEGHSFAAASIAGVRAALAGKKIGLLVLDADGAVQRDLDCYAELLSDGCWMVIDDYFGPGDNIKVGSTRAEVDALIRRGALFPCGLYGWGTWIGQWNALGRGKTI